MGRARHLRIAAAWVSIISCGRGGPFPSTPSDLVEVSAESPFAPGCNGAPPRGTLYSGTAVEPAIAVNPTNRAHWLGIWQQDRWSNSGANGLLIGVSWNGGRDWTRGALPFSSCGGGNALNQGNYERASDPWVTFAPDGTAYAIGLSFDYSNGLRKAILASRSSDGGLTWDAPTVLGRDEDLNVALDKETITADRTDARFVYAVWDRLVGLADPDPTHTSGATWFSRRVDGNWESSRSIYDAGADAQTISNQIVVLPGGALVNFFVKISAASQPRPRREIALQKSTDKGMTWSFPTVIAELLGVGVRDVSDGRPVRSGLLVPSFAADGFNGNLYAVWEDARFSGGVRDGIAFIQSTDAGASWSAPMQLNAGSTFAAFTPVIAVADNGAIGVTYYEFSTPQGLFSGDTRYWLRTSTDGGATWTGIQLGTPFDLGRAPIVQGYFLGDYQGLAHDGRSFVPLFAAAAFSGAGNPARIFVKPD